MFTIFRLQEMTSKSQVTEDSKEQIGLKWLYANCDQVRFSKTLFFHCYILTPAEWKTCPHFCVKENQSCAWVGSMSSFFLISQDLVFASRLVKQGQVSAEVLLEALRLLLPTLPESELLSITDALCPKLHTVSSSAEPEHSG